MAFFTEIGKKYNVTGVMGGWDNYTPAIPDDEHARGESTGTAVLQLKGKQIEVISHEHRVEEGYPAYQGGPYAPYEVVKVKEVGGDETEYYAWVVYNGDINVEEIVEQEDPPDPPDPPDPVTDPDPPIDPPKPDEDIITNGTEVHVRAGETVVLELESEGESTEEEQVDEYGSIEVELVDEEGNPYLDVEAINLLSEGSIYTVPIDKATGKGIRENIAPGEYELALDLGTVFFDQKMDTLSNSEQNKLNDITKRLIQSKIDFETIRCIGFADDEGSQKYKESLCLKRAIHVRQLLIQMQSKISENKISTGIGDLLVGDGVGKQKRNRKVNILSTGPASSKSKFEPSIPNHPICLKENITRWFKTKDINIMLGEDAKKNEAISNDAIDDDYLGNPSNYLAHVPVGEMKECFLVLTNKINIYKQGPGNELYIETFNPQPKMVVAKDNEIKYYDIYQIHEGIHDSSSTTNRRRDLAYFIHEIVKEKDEDRYSLRLTHQVNRYGIDPESPEPTLHVEVVYGQTFLIHFQFAKSSFNDLSSIYQKYLATIRKHISDHNAITKVEIVGHTDKVDTEDSNVDLSLKRSENIEKALLQSESIKNRVFDNKLRIIREGKGESNPLIDKSDSMSRAFNRRVEITVYWDYTLLETLN